MMMSKTSDTSKFDHAKLDHHTLADSELDAVSGGWSLSGIPGYSVPQSPPPTGHLKMGDIVLKR
jgi:hypothetical protein